MGSLLLSEVLQVLSAVQPTCSSFKSFHKIEAVPGIVPCHRCAFDKFAALLKIYECIAKLQKWSLLADLSLLHDGK